MAEHLEIAAGNKAERYALLTRQIESVVAGESDQIARMANIASMIHHTFGFWWTGFYRADGNELILGPFQGSLACTRIAFGRGVCGTAWREEHTIVVPDVEQFEGHIACSSASRSEIVVPIRTNGTIIGVLDIDSRELATFDATDQEWLERIVELLVA